MFNLEAFAPDLFLPVSMINKHKRNPLPKKL